MSDPIREILDELYAVAPELRSRETELVPLVQKLLAAKPEAALDPVFRQELKQRLLNLAEKPTHTPPLTQSFPMRKFSYALFTVFVLAIVGVGTYTYWRTALRTKPADVTSISSAPKVSITNRDAAAFGAFSSNPAATQSRQLSEATGFGGGAPTKVTSDTALPSIGMPAPTTYEYVYTGSEISIPDLPVLKRANQLPTTTLQNVLQSANLGLIDLEKFTNLKLQQVALAEDRDEGYSISIDLNAGSIGLYQNWARWTMPMREAVKNVNGTESTTLPSDEQVITMANAFLDKYGIPRSAYGTPVVSKDFLGYGRETLSVAPLYIQSLQVVYPLNINGKPVVNENGYPAGLSVVIELDLNRVTSVSNLTSLSYEASAYSLVSDTAKVMAVVNRGGMYGSKPVDGSVKKVQIEVGSPTVGYYPSQYQIDQTPTEYLIPALIFPITKAPQGEQLYRSAIVVPLVQDVLEPQVSTITGSEGSSSSSAGTAVDTVTPTTR